MEMNHRGARFRSDACCKRAFRYAGGSAGVAMRNGEDAGCCMRHVAGYRLPSASHAVYALQGLQPAIAPFRPLYSFIENAVEQPYLSSKALRSIVLVESLFALVVLTVVL